MSVLKRTKSAVLPSTVRITLGPTIPTWLATPIDSKKIEIRSNSIELRSVCFWAIRQIGTNRNSVKEVRTRI
jgi:hypothetical protein